MAADWRLMLLLPGALLLQACHPVIGGGVGEHSIYSTDPWGRLHMSWWPTAALAFYGDKTPAFARDLRAAHKNITGVDHLGRRYHAWEPEAYFFVLATGFNASELLADRFGRPLTAREREELYAGTRQMARLVGLRDRDIPADLATFRVWYDRVLTSRLEDHPTARQVLAMLDDTPPPPRVPSLVWRPASRLLAGPLNRLITIGTTPPVVRARLGLTWTTADERRLRAAASSIRAFNTVLPPSARRITQTIALRNQNQIIATMAASAARASS
jgi:uncharacterized protein (DUF2236 family)